MLRRGAGTGQICHKFFLAERILRSRWGPTQRAIVHWTIAFRSSNLSFLQNKKDILSDVEKGAGTGQIWYNFLSVGKKI